ncbi:MAG: hypothetical protein JST79_08740 [Acidobacteria bacterium]|nr:hypothetical protein [Acidobacteriota bacterium]
MTSSAFRLLRLACCWLLFGILGIGFSWGKNRPPSQPVVDREYSAALAAANFFLHAWQIGDQENGIVILSDAVRRRTSPEQIETFFSPDPEAAYEISRGKRRNPGRYSFPVVLFGAAGVRHGAGPRYSEIVLVRTGKREWVVDKLP